MSNLELATNIANQIGFSHTGILNVPKLDFNQDVRAMCKANKCNNYSKNWSCPPGIGPLSKSKKLAKEFQEGIIVQTTAQLEDDFDFDTIRETGKIHNQKFGKLYEELKKVFTHVLPMGAGTCQICPKCSYPDSPCRFPDKRISSMEAYGLMVSKVCIDSGVKYYYGPKTLTFTGCVMFKN